MAESYPENQRTRVQICFLDTYLPELEERVLNYWGKFDFVTVTEEDHCHSHGSEYYLRDATKNKFIYSEVFI